MAAPREWIHLQSWRIRQLNEEDFLTGNVLDARRVIRKRERVKAVDADPERGVIGPAHQVPGFSIRAYVSTPGQGFIGDADAAFSRALRRSMQLPGGALRIAQRLGRNVGAHQQHGRAEFDHDVEFALDPIEVLSEDLVGDALQVTKWLEQIDAETQILGELADLPRGSSGIDQVVFEDLDAIESSRGDGPQLVLQGAAERDRG